MIEGDVAGYVCNKGAGVIENQQRVEQAKGDGRNLANGRSVLLELVDSSDIVGLDERAVVARGAGQLGAAIGDIVVAGAVGCGRELLEKLKVREGGRINCYLFTASMEGRS